MEEPPPATAAGDPRQQFCSSKLRWFPQNKLVSVDQCTFFPTSFPIQHPGEFREVSDLPEAEKDKSL